MYHFINKTHKWDKIGTHGISIGAVAACHLAGKNLVYYCFADRAFSRIEDIIQDYPCGTFIKLLYKLMFFDKSNNVDNFITVKNNLI